MNVIWLFRRRERRRILGAIKDTGGIYTRIASNLGVEREEAVKLVESLPGGQEARKAEEEATLDIAEGYLIDEVRAGKKWAIDFYVSCKGMLMPVKAARALREGHTVTLSLKKNDNKRRGVSA